MAEPQAISDQCRFPTRPLGECARFTSGGTPKKSEAKYWEGKIPWLTPKDMAQFDGATQDRISEEAIGNGTRLAPCGTIFIAVRGMSLHNEIRIVRATEPMAFNQDIKALIPNGDIDGRFLFYALLAKTPELRGAVEAAGHGTGVLPTQYLKNLPIPALGTTEQHAIAATLGALDAKIELNRRMNATLEQTARALFRDWFVDFGPTRAKMAGADPYLAPDLWDLFPDRLDEEGRPEGWEAGILADHFDLRMGQSPPGDTYNDAREGLPFFQGRADFGFRFPSNRKYCTAPSRRAIAGDTLVSVRAPVGDINMAAGECCIGRGVAAIRHKSGARSFTYYSALALQPKLAEYENTGTVFGAINKKQFEALPTFNPGQYLVDLFEKFVSPIDERILVNEAESRTLAETRDYLLPRLMSGEVCTEDAADLQEFAE